LFYCSSLFRFAAFVDVLAIMTRGTPDEKMEFCYKMIDADGDGQLTHKELVGLLKYHPMKRLQKQNNALNRISAFQPGGGAMMEGLQEEDEEAAEAAAAAEADTDDSARPRMASTKTTDPGRTKTLGRRRQEASDNQRIAFEVVDEVRDSFPHADGDGDRETGTSATSVALFFQAGMLCTCCCNPAFSAASAPALLAMT